MLEESSVQSSSRPVSEPDDHVDENSGSVSVSLKNLSITVVSNNWSGSEVKSKTILQPVSAHIEEGSLFAILGGSGSGKTSLLNVIAGRFSKASFRIDGTISFPSKEDYKRIGYVSQHDYLVPYLTVRETLSFTARLKIPPRNYGTQVDDIIMELGLKECADTFVGSSDVTSGKRGLSGGERRRVSVGIQLISNPRILCADEPTSGLDAFTAVTVVEALHRLTRRVCPSFEDTTSNRRTSKSFASENRTTVICSIHQPRSDVFELFDHVLLLSAGGKPVYCGLMQSMLNYFSKLGLACPVNSNPADYFVDISSEDISPEDIMSQSLCPEDVGSDGARTFFALSSGPDRVNFLVEMHKKHSNRQGDEKQQQSFVNNIYPREFEAQNTSGTDPNWNSFRESDYMYKPMLSVDRVGDFFEDRSMSYSANWFAQVYYLTKRSFTNQYRDSSNITGGLLQAVILGLVVMGIFWQLSGSQADIESRNGLIYIAISMEYYILMIILVERCCSEIRIFDREVEDAIYVPSAYLTSQIISSVPLFIVQPILYSIPIYFGCNLRHGLNHVLIFFAVNVLETFVISGLVWMCLIFSRSFSVVSLIANMNFTFISITAGFLVNLKDMPTYVSWVKNISFLNYSYQILMSNEYSDRTLSGCESENPEDCLVFQGSYILETHDIDEHNNQENFLALIAIGGTYFAIAYLGLYYIRFPVTAGAVGESFGEDSSEDSIIQADDIEETKDSPEENLSWNHSVNLEPLLSGNTHKNNNVSIQLTSISLSVPAPVRKIRPEIDKGGLEETLDTWNFLEGTEKIKQEKGRKFILKNVSGNCSPGKITALMGGSGSGKTTLLNLIAGRIPQKILSPPLPLRPNQGDTPLRRYPSQGPGFDYDRSRSRVSSTVEHVPRKIPGCEYTGFGSILFDGKELTPAQLRETIGYVQQFDFHLPSLTVKETLLFHARLKLDTEVSLEKKEQRVNEVIEILGLKKCSTTRVGGSEKKGISGGEKRRLSIGVQLLADPAVCLLDEPTTGLDACTARSVVKILKKLAEKGRTVVVSIHQPRYDIYALLDDVLLLSRGHVVWAGAKEKMLKYFQTVGFECPVLTNPADFILDISSIDFRSLEKEEHSKKRLKLLVNSFDTTGKPKNTEDLSGKKMTKSSYLTPNGIVTRISYTDNPLINEDPIEPMVLSENGVSDAIHTISLKTESEAEKEQDGTKSKEDTSFSSKFLRSLSSKSKAEKESNEDDSNSHLQASYLYASSNTTTEQKPKKTSKVKSIFFTLPLLVQRSSMNIFRQPDLCYNRLSQSVFYALILSCFYAPIGDNQNSIQNRIGVLFEILAICFIGMLSCIAIFPEEKNVFFREYIDGDYSSLAFFLTYFIIGIPFLVLSSIIVGALMTYAIGLQPNLLALIIFSYCVFTFIFVGECIGVIFSSIFMHVGFSVNIMSVVISVFGLLAGFVSINMPEVLRDIGLISPLTWGSYILANVTFDDETFTCDNDELDSDGNCPLDDGDEVLELYKFDGGDGKYGVTFHLWMMGLIAALYFLITYLVLRLRAFQISH